MDFIIDAIVEWLKGLLVDGIMGNLDGLFDNVNQSVGEIATQVGTTPADWNAGVFSMIRQISETAILPIAGVILTFVMTYELIQMLIERNNLHEVDTWMFFKWVFKTFVAVMILPGSIFQNFKPAGNVYHSTKAGALPFCLCWMPAYLNYYSTEQRKKTGKM